MARSSFVIFNMFLRFAWNALSFRFVHRAMMNLKILGEELKILFNGDMDYSSFLKETSLLDYRSSSIQSLLSKRGWLLLSEIDRAKAVYNFVKDEILFGYNVSDKRKASDVLKDGYGQCNTKGILLMALFRAANIPCKIHGFTIDKILQKGAMTGLVYRSAPKEILHSYVEAFIGGKWYNLEGFILDNKYLSSLQKKFKPNSDGSFIGHGVATKDFMNPPIEFDLCDTYIQKEGIVRDLGVYSDPDSLLKEHCQNTRLLKGLAYRFIGRRLMNRNVRKIRES